MLSAKYDPAISSADFGPIRYAVWQGIWTGITSSPWAIAAFAGLMLLVVVRIVHAVAYPRGRRDPVRRFASTDRAEIVRRAGGRCEAHGWITGRCGTTQGLEADHIHPHSRGGWTNIQNGQALCKRHNRTKSATIPFKWQLNRIAKRRTTYYPPGVSGTVSRRAAPARGRVR